MSSYFFDIITEYINYDRTENMAQAYAVELIDMKSWCEEMLDLAQVPEGHFRTAFLNEMFSADSDEPYRLWRYIQDTCMPDEDQEDDAKSANISTYGGG